MMNTKKVIMGLALTLLLASPAMAEPDYFKGYEKTAASDGRDAERNGDYKLAKAHWEMVKLINPKDTMAENKLKYLDEKIKREVEKNFQAAQKFAEANKIHDARRAALNVLALDSGHRGAANVMQSLSGDDQPMMYEVKNRETLASIAKKTYGSDDQAAVIAYFNNMSPKDKPKAGSKLKLPGVSLGVAVWPKDAGGAYKKAKSALGAGNYSAAIRYADAVLQHDPESPANSVVNMAYYNQAKAALAAKRFDAAESLFQSLNPSFKDVRALQRSIDERANVEAEARFQAGLNKYLSQDLEGAIKDFKGALQLNPDHAQAKKSLKDAEDTLAKVKKL